MRDDFQRMVLRETLNLAVPMHMAELDGLADEHLAVIATSAATVIGTHGDDLQYGGRHCVGAFNALARGLAAAALIADGGVDFQPLGLHWCRDPHCRASSRMEHADIGPDDQLPELPPEPAPRPVVDIHLPAYDQQAA